MVKEFEAFQAIQDNVFIHVLFQYTQQELENYSYDKFNISLDNLQLLYIQPGNTKRLSLLVLLLVVVVVYALKSMQRSREITFWVWQSF